MSQLPNLDSNTDAGWGNKNKIIAISVIIFLVVLSAVFIIFTINKINKSDVVQIEKDAWGCQNNISTDCVKEGEYVDHPDKDSFECCPDLSKIDARPLDDDCAPIIPEGGSGMEPGWICINCGDGICNDKANENMCNCPEDCSGSECVKEGNSYTDLSHITGIPQAGCCPGLESGIFYSILNGECLRSEDAQVCIDCPNGECGAGENKCNCPEDCADNFIQPELIYQKEASWGPCPDPEGGCWQKDYLYQDGRYDIVTKKGTSSKALNGATMEMIRDYIRSAGLLADSCEHDTVLDLWVTYRLTLDGQENRINFPGCEEELYKLDSMIEIGSLEILDRQAVIEKAKIELHGYLNGKDHYQVDLAELEPDKYEIFCKYNEAGDPIMTGSCWWDRYPGNSVKQNIMAINDDLEKLYYASFAIESKHQMGCGLTGGEVLITDRGRILKTEEIELCIDG